MKNIKEEWLNELVVKASKAILASKENLKTWKKHTNETVTSADLQSENIIMKIIEERFPDISIVSEESANVTPKITKFPCFIIDPLDGTQCFLNGSKFWGISVGIVDETKNPSGGIIHLPESNITIVSTPSSSTVQYNQKNLSKPTAYDKNKVCVAWGPWLSESEKEKIQSSFKNSSFELVKTDSAVHSLSLFLKGEVGSLIGFKDRVWDICAGFSFAKKLGAEIIFTDKTKILWQEISFTPIVMSWEKEPLEKCVKELL